MCIRCYTPLIPSAKYCLNCGEKLITNNHHFDDPENLSSFKGKNKESIGKRTIRVLGVTVILSLFIKLLFSVANQENSSTKSSRPPTIFTNTNKTGYNSNDKNSCYGLGYKYGRYTSLVLKVLHCPPEDDFAIPEGCRGIPETELGIAAGTKISVESVW